MKGLKAGIISVGKGTLDSNVVNGFDTMMTWKNPDAKPRWYTVPFIIYIIQHPEAGWILWDMGSRPDSGEAWPEHITTIIKPEFTEEERLENQLALLGLKPADIKYVLMSHLHMDHTGYLPMFKDSAEFYVSREEVMNASAAVLNSTNVSTHGWYIRDEVLCPVGQYHYIDRDTEIFPGITLLPLPGHTSGCLGCILELESGVKILPGDAIYGDYVFHGNVPGVLQDGPAFHESVRKVKAYQKKYNAEIWFPHDADQFSKFKKVPFMY
ncbi:MAG: N-acyl homoserine lactonase family protein [Clostridiales Family XIII bacterium]|jgi:glyoxylase-like metal-dependent hydrolase (beta-lactamase superfamily II)|nr:N-acyl homoserine lactonase family protein [Clostridiales Family XIII bacterium]